MKDSKFIELLNLYVDHQISAADAALLEAEIHRDPERRRIYRQYCQMQKACVMLADSFRTEAPAAGNIVEFRPPNRRLGAVALAVGSLAAAACVALVMVSRSPVRAPGAAPAADAVALRTPAVAPQVAPIPLPARAALQPAFTTVVGDNTNNRLAAGDLDWMKRVQLERVPTVQELWFESQPTIQPQDLSFTARATPQQEKDAQMTAFRFQK